MYDGYVDDNGDDDDMAACPTPFLVLKVHPKFCSTTPLLSCPTPQQCKDSKDDDEGTLKKKNTGLFGSFSPSGHYGKAPK